MSSLVIGLVLVAALLHATWNAIAKSSGSPEYSIASFQLVGSLMCLAIAPFIPFPNNASWLLILASVLIHNAYYFSLTQAYRAGDLSQVYPLFRGSAPVMVAIGALVFAGEQLSAGTWIGILFVSLGVSSLSFFSKRFGPMPPKALLWGMVTAVLIAMYTVVDGLGVRATENSLSYIVWLFILEAIPISYVLALYRRKTWGTYLKTNLGMILIGGLTATLAYGLVIFAMSLGTMAVVSSLRETSVIFAAIFGSVFLREPFGINRVRAAILVAVGVIIMKTIE